MTTPGCGLARAKLASFVDALEKTGWDKARTIIKGTRLWGTLTPIRKMTTDLTHATFEAVTRNGVAVPLDMVQAIAHSVGVALKKGEWVSPDTFRSVAFDMDRMGFAMRKEGFSKGIAKGIETMRNSGIDPEMVNSAFEVSNVRFNNPIGRAIGELPFTVFEGVTKPWWQMAWQTSLYGQAKLRAMQEGGSTAVQTARINALLETPSDVMVMRAVEDAQRAVFKDKTVLGEFASKIKTGLGNIGQDKQGTEARAALQATPEGRGMVLNNAPKNAGMRRFTQPVSLLAEDIVPYTGVPSSIITKGLVDYTPFGIIKTMMTQIPKDSRVEGEAVMGLARASVGTALWYLGYKMSEAGMVQGAGAESNSDREVDNARGRQADAIRVGKKWLAIGWLGPQALPFLIGATVQRAQANAKQKAPNDQPSAWHTAGETAAAGAKLLTEDTYLNGMKQVVDAIQSPGKNSARLAQALVPVPQLVGQVSTALDDTRRQPDGPGQAIASRLVPGYSRTLPAKSDVFGRNEKVGLGGWASAVQAFVDPFKTTEEIASPAANELARLAVGVSRPGKTVTIATSKVPRTPQEINDDLRAYGPGLERTLNAIVQMPEFARLPDEIKRLQLKSVVSGFHAQIRGNATGAIMSRPDTKIDQSGRISTPAMRP